jgi:CPA1 family monovalent cation:H+ antiporter
MEFYTIITLLISLSALFSFLNEKYIKIPNTIALMIFSILASFILLIIGNFIPDIISKPLQIVKSIDFYDILIHMMLGFMLFAGAIHVHYHDLKKELYSIISLAAIGTTLSTFIVGSGMYFLLQFFSIPMDYISCLLFGALISPTDPIAVLSILKKTNLPIRLETRIVGESLFNDGIAVVLFLTLLDIHKAGIEQLEWSTIGITLIREILGGIIFGILLGWSAYKLLKNIDHYKVEVLITISTVMGGYMIAEHLHISGALAMVVSGIFIGNIAFEKGMSTTTQEYVSKFWELIDETLNAMLFVLIGLELLLIPIDFKIALFSCISFILLILARGISVWISSVSIAHKTTFNKKEILILTWGGLRGGISIALAISLAQNAQLPIFTPITFIIVILSILLQGLSIEKLIKSIFK